MASCSTPQLPYREPCSGYGTCMNGTCICSTGWSGNGIWFDLSPNDCNINDLALTVLNYIAYAFTIIVSIGALYRLFSYGRLKILKCCRPDFDLPNHEAIRTAQISLLLTLFCGLFGFVQYSLFSFARYFPHMSWASAIIFILFHLSLYSFTWHRGTTIIIVSLRVIKGIRGNAESIAFRIRLIGSILNGTVGLAHTITILGTIASPTVATKLQFYYAYYAVSLVYQLCWLISVLKYYTAFINTMDSHLRHAQSLKGSQQQQQTASDSDNDLEAALAKLRRLRATFIGSVGVQTLLSICCIVLPPLGSYYIPVWQTTGSFAVLSFLRELKQQEDERRQREGRNTSSATSTAGTTRSATASSAATNTASTVSGSLEPLLDE